MVFGNKGDTSGSGVAFSRDEVTGEPEPSGDFLVNAQGEDVVSGVRNTQDIAELRDVMPEAHAQLMEILRELEAHYKDMQDTEFTIEEGRLYMLQTRNAKRPAQAGVRFACDAVAEGLLTKAEAIDTIDTEKLDALLHPTFDPSVDYAVLAHGVAASPGAAKGEIVFTAADAVAAAADGRARHPRAPVHRGRGRRRLLRRAGHPHRRGRQGQPRGARRARHGPPGGHRRERAGHRPRQARAARRGHAAARGRLHRDRRHDRAGHVDDVPLVEPQMDEHFEQVLTWCDELRTLGIRANADTPEDARKARAFGAEGIGLCRTEHMFMAADRQPKMREMILADTSRSGAPRSTSCCRCSSRTSRTSSRRWTGCPSRSACSTRRCTSSCRPTRTTPALTRCARSTRCSARAAAGWRSCTPRSTRCRCGRSCAPQRAVTERLGHPPRLEVMVPLIDYERELEIIEELIFRVAREEGVAREDYLCGTMIELPRACFLADTIAEHADFFSFGTNDLTQTALGFSRDDIEGKILARYIESKIFDRSPFETIDTPGVGQLVRMGAWLGRKTKVELKLGVCGEHGGDPDSIDFFHHSGIDYVSCSPFRVPVARVAAAQAAIRAT